MSSPQVKYFVRRGGLLLASVVLTGFEMFMTVNPGRRSRARFALAIIFRAFNPDQISTRQSNTAELVAGFAWFAYFAVH